MSTIYFTYPQAPKHLNQAQSFKKPSDSVPSQTDIPIEVPKAYIPSYTYHTTDTISGQSSEPVAPNQLIVNQTPIQKTEIKSERPQKPPSRYNFLQNEGNDILSQFSYFKKEDPIKVMYQDIKFSKENYQFNKKFGETAKIPEKEESVLIFEKETVNYTDNFQKTDKLDFSRNKSISDTISKDNQSVSSASFIKKLSFQGSTFPPSRTYAFENKNQNSSLQIQQLKSKISKLQKEITQVSLQKGQLIIQIAEVSRQNRDLKNQLYQIKQNKLNTVEIQPKEVKIDQQYAQEIKNIKELQNQINKSKQEFMQLASRGYQSEIKRIKSFNNNLKIQLQSLKIDLQLAKEEIKQKTLKIQFLQKQFKSIESKNRDQAKNSTQKIQSQITEKSSQVIALRYSLSSLENKYKEQRKQLSDKDQFIMKHILGKGGEDMEAIKLLANQSNPFARRSVEDLTQVMSVDMKSSRQ